MSLTYPLNKIWLVRSTPKTGEPIEGSAIAVRLQRVVEKDGKKIGDPNTARTYLLTCTHVLRGQSSDGEDGFGKIVQAESIRVWPPAVGQTDDQARAVRICEAIRGIDFGEVPPAKRNLHVNDWVFLEIIDDNAAKLPGIYEEDLVASTPRLSRLASIVNSYCVIGYPGGTKSLVRGNTHPTQTGLCPYRDDQEGLLRLTGDETRPGMSGGGVFAVWTLFGIIPIPMWRPQLAGIHRARNYDTLQLHAVNVTVIRDHVESDDLPFEFCRRKRPRPNPASWIAVLTLIALLGIGYWIWNLPITVYVLAQMGRLENGRPVETAIANAHIEIHPAGFQMTSNEAAETDKNGFGKFRFRTDTWKKPISGHFIVTHAPGIDDPVTTKSPARKHGDAITAYFDPTELAHNREIRLVIVPFVLLDDYLAAIVNESLETNQKFADATTTLEKFQVVRNEIDSLRLSNTDAELQLIKSVTPAVLDKLPAFTATASVARKWPMADDIVNGFGFEAPGIREQLYESIASQMLKARPSIPVNDATHDNVRQPSVERGHQIEQSVCYVQCKGQMPFSGTGFVIGKNLILTTLFNEDWEFEYVGFGNDPTSETDPTRVNVLQLTRFPTQEIALLRVPDLNRGVLRLASAKTFRQDHKNEIVVVGYSADDPRLPQAIRKILAFSIETAKRIMPGVVLAEVTNPRPSLIHDATTTGGTSGSPVIDVSTGLVVGIHRGGQWRDQEKENQAIPVWELLKNPEIATLLSGSIVSPLGIDELRLETDLMSVVEPLVTGLSADFKDLETHHKEEKTIKIGPLEQKIVIYWWSVLSGTVQARNRGESISLSASVIERNPTEVGVSLFLKVPLEGTIDARAEADNPRIKLVGLKTDYSTVATATVEAKLLLSPDQSQVTDVQLPVWQTVLSDTRFGEPLADRLAPVIENHVNNLIAKEMEKLLTRAKQDIERQLKALKPN